MENLTNDNLDQVADDTSALSKVTEAYAASKRDQQGAFTLFRDLYRLWRFYKSKGSSVKVFDPIGFTITVGLLSKMFVKPPAILATVTQTPQGPLSAIEDQVIAQQMKAQVDQAASQVKSLLEYQLDNPLMDEPLDEQYISFITEMLICGTAVAKVCWDTKFITQWEDQPSMMMDELGQPIADPMGQPIPQMDEMGQPVMERQRVDKLGFDDPVFEHIPLENFYKQPGAKNIYKSKYVIYEYWESLDEFLEKAEQEGNYKNVDQVVAGTYNKSDQSGVGNARGIRGTGNTTEKYKDKIHFLEYWEDDRLIVVANEAIVVRDEDNPNNHGRKPFISMPYVKVPHEFYGIGALEPTVDLHKAVNISLTQRLEYISNLLNQQFFVVNNRNVNEDDIIEQYPIVHTDSADAVVPVPKTSVGQEAFVSGNELIAEIERATGYSGYSSGVTNSAQDKTQGTLGGIQMIVQEAATRFDLTLKRFEKMVLRNTAQLFLELDRQYLSSTEGKLIKMSGGGSAQFAMFTKQVLNEFEYHIEIMPGSVGFVDKQQKFQNFQQFFGMGVQYAPNFDINAGLKEAAEYLNIDNPERFFMVGPDGRPQLNVIAMEKQAQARQGNQMNDFKQRAMAEKQNARQE